MSKDKLLSMLDKSEQVKITKAVRDIRKENFNRDKILRDIRTLYESEEDYYESVRTSTAFNNNFVEYEGNGDKDNILSVKGYLDMIKQYLNDIINDHKTQGEWEIQKTYSKDTKDSKDFNETCAIHTTSDNIEIMVSNETDDIVKNLFKSLFQKYQEGLEKSVTGSEFIFDSIGLLYYKQISLNRGGSYIDSPEWLKNKKATINPKNNDDKCFQYAVTVALNYEQIKKDPQRITKIKPFIDQYNWKKINFPSPKNDWDEFGKINKTIALNILLVPHNTKEIRHAYKSKHNLSRENQVILLMITDGKKHHYLAVKILSALLKGTASKHKGDFYCLNCLHSYRTEDHDYCYVDMSNKDNNILKYNHGEKSMKAPFIIYADIESLLEKISICDN